MKNYYIPKKVISYIFLILLFTTLIDGYIFFLFLSCFVLLLFLYRVTSVNLAKTDTNDLKSVFSPVNGRVKKVIENKDFNKVILSSRLFASKGLLMPISGSIDSVDEHVTICSKLDEKIKFKFSKGYLIKSFVWIKAGDLAKLASNIGFLGVFGQVEMIFDKNSKILVTKKQKVYAGESVIAGVEVNHE